MQCKKTKPLIYRFGFTLSEVLITLGIIGVVAALTIPTVINNANDAAYQSAAKKALSAASQAYKAAVYENGTGFGAYNGTNNTQSVVKFNALKSQLKIMKDCPYNSNATGKCWSNSGVGLKGYSASGASMASNDGSEPINISFTTNDGMFWMLYSYSATNGIDIFYIDVNGDKGPNDWGKDVYMFRLDDTEIRVFNTGGLNTIKHNDGTVVNTTTEFLPPFQ